MTLRIGLVIGFLVVVFGGVFGWKAFVAYKTQEYIANMKFPAVTVSAAKVRQDEWQPKIATVGSLSATQGVEISSEVPGKIVALHFNSGSAISEEDLLLELDTTAEEAQLKALSAELVGAKLDYERATELSQTSAVSKAQLDKTRSEMERLEAKVEEQQALIQKKSIRAPFSGTLGIRRVNLGEYVSAGTPIVTLQSLDPIYADFTLPERVLNAISVGQTIEVSVAAFPDRQFLGRVTAVSPKVEETTRNVHVQATLQNNDDHLRPGMFARVHVHVDGDPKVLTLPRTAVTYYPYGESVFTIEEQGEDLIVQRKQIESGREVEGRVEIISGLNEGDRVVNTGQLKLRNGQRITIDNSVVLPKVVGRR